MHYKISVITPISGKVDYLVNTVLDGLYSISKENGGFEFKYLKPYKHPFSFLFPLRHGLNGKKFIEFSKKADLVFLCFGTYGANVPIAELINRWDKTIYIDGSEAGKNRRYDINIRKQLEEGMYTGLGKIDLEMKKRCVLYFRRERPYLEGIIPFPFGIESRYIKYFRPKQKKDIDFVSIFGQDAYPILRREVTQYLKNFCAKNGFTCATERTRKIPFLQRGPFSSKKFYKILASAKVGISIGGGGFDTGRFWEILGNNCILLTERIAIFPEGSAEVNYTRIHEFDDLESFKKLIEKLAYFLRNNYGQKDLESEYQEILKQHSTKARVMFIIDKAKKAGILQ